MAPSCKLFAMWFRVTLLLLPLLHNTYGLYEDQIGKFDWRKQYVGKVKYIAFDRHSSYKRVIVATEQNVIAAIDSKSGDILWRQVLEKDSRGTVHYMNVNNKAIVVSGNYLRAWDTQNGFLSWSWVLPLASHKDSYLGWTVSDDTFIQVECIPFSGVNIAQFALRNGNAINSKTIAAPWVTPQSKCVVTGHYLVCFDEPTKLAFLLDLVAENVEPKSFPLNEIFAGSTSFPSNIRAVVGPLTILSVEMNNGEQHVVRVADDGLHWLYKTDEKAELAALVDEERQLLVEFQIKYGLFTMKGMDVKTGTSLPDLTGKTAVPTHYGVVDVGAAVCAGRKDRSGIGCRVVISTSDHAILGLQQPGPGKLLWEREDALASVLSVEMLDLPLSEGDVTIDAEFDSKETGCFGMALKRLVSQFHQLRVAFQTIMGAGEPLSANQRLGLVRDEFGLHKMIVVTTAASKIFGIDNSNGHIIWRQRLDNVLPFDDKLPLYVQRSSRHYPFPAQCTVLGKQKSTGNGILFVFNPISGQPMDGDNGIVLLGAAIKQVMLMHHANEESMRGLLLLDDQERLTVYPKTTQSVVAAHASEMYMFTADTKMGALVGYSLSQSTAQELKLTRVWSMHLSPATQTIMQIVSKSTVERVHSQGRVLGDRSVLYKFLNPNLVAIVTEGYDTVQKSFINVYLLDAVSGSVIYSANHKRVHGPVHFVHSENWMVYSYFSEKSRRFEIASLELYEGQTQSNSTAFSSLAAVPLPIVERQAYIFPSSIQAMKETITEKGITTKHILVALSSGAILELPRFFLDPRRSVTATAEMRDEGVIPYIPELPVHQDAIINYNQSLARVSGMHTAPSGLESTCLVLVHGLDLFYTRVTPSKNFDLLKDDFDHFLILAVLITLTVASYVTKRLAARKALKQAWK